MTDILDKKLSKDSIRCRNPIADKTGIKTRWGTRFCLILLSDDKIVWIPETRAFISIKNFQPRIRNQIDGLGQLNLLEAVAGKKSVMKTVPEDGDPIRVDVLQD